MSSNSHPKRRKIILDRGFQFSVLRRFAVAFSLSFLFCFCLSVGMPAAIGYLRGEPDAGVAQTVLQARAMLFSLAFPMLGTLLYLSWFGIRETFRIAGPSYRFRTVFDELKCCRIPRGVRIRKDDYLQETAASFHEALVELHDRVESVQRLGHAAVEELSQLHDKFGEECGPARDAMAHLQNALADFTLTEAAPESEPRPVVQPQPPLAV